MMLVRSRSYALSALTRAFSSFDLSLEHKMIQTTCREFANKELKPVAADLDRECRFPADQVKRLGELGLMAVNVPRAFGGGGLDTLSLAIVVEELSRACGSTGLIVSIHNVLYMNLIERFGTDEQKEAFLRPFVAKKIGAFALSEADAGSDVANILTTATKDGDSYLLSGTKAWVTSATEAAAAVVFATMDRSLNHKGITAFLVPLDAPGVSIGPSEEKIGVRATSTCNVHLENVRVPATHILGEIGNGFKIAMQTLDQGRIGIASQALGIGQAALDLAIDYASQRIAFGQPLIKLASVQTRIAETALRLEAARLLTWKAAATKDREGAASKFSSMSKLAASETATFAAHNCIQILGGMGVVKAMPAERLYRDARMTEIYGGISDIQRLVVAQQVIKEHLG